MSRHNLRRITIEGDLYLWRAGHYHLSEFRRSKCAEMLLVYLEGYKLSPLKLHFRLEDNVLLQSRAKNGDWVIDWGCLVRRNRTINLNRPAVVSRFIHYYLDNGWQPAIARQALEVCDALALLDVLELPEGAN